MVYKCHKLPWITQQRWHYCKVSHTGLLSPLLRNLSPSRQCTVLGCADMSPTPVPRGRHSTLPSPSTAANSCSPPRLRWHFPTRALTLSLLRNWNATHWHRPAAHRGAGWGQTRRWAGNWFTFPSSSYMYSVYSYVCSSLAWRAMHDELYINKKWAHMRIDIDNTWWHN